MQFNVTKLFSIFYFSLSLLVAGTGLANAGSDTDAVVSEGGGMVGDSNGNCVRTMWENENDPCVVRQQAITNIMRMDERIAYFGFNKFALTEEEKQKLTVVAEVLKKYNIRAVKIVGYTDRIGSDAYNDKLSERRANEVRNYLNSKVKLKTSIVQIKGLGKSNELKDCNEVTQRKELISCLGANRRVEIVVDYYDFAHDQDQVNDTSDNE